MRKRMLKGRKKQANGYDKFPSCAGSVLLKAKPNAYHQRSIFSENSLYAATNSIFIPPA
jgi:hypothetical protein